MTNQEKREMKLKDTLNDQAKYVQQQIKEGLGKAVVFPGAFLRGMRDIGYKNPVHALAELIDNAVQAGATTIRIVFGYDKGSNRVRPDQIAVFDDGVGMIPEMISFAVRWGGTHREGLRDGFGRFGYGLPSAVVSLAKQYSVYSRHRDSGGLGDGEWHRVQVNIDELGAHPERTEELLTARLGTPPEWVFEHVKGVGGPDDAHGTVIVLEELDRLRKLGGWIKSATLESKLLQGLGVLYRHWLARVDVSVNGNDCEAVDPLFLMPHARHHSETIVRAVEVEARTFEVETPEGLTGTVKIRASWLPADFNWKEPSKFVPGQRPEKAQRTSRQPIMKQYNGLMILRQGRQIDVVQPRFGGGRFGNNDRNIKVEIDFSAELDEYFTVTTAKQQIVIIEQMWEMLQHSGSGGGALKALVKDLRAHVVQSKSELAAKALTGPATAQPVPAEKAMIESKKFTQLKVEPSEDKKRIAEENLRQEAEEKARLAGVNVEVIREELEAGAEARPYAREFKSIDEGPFYMPKRLGEQKVLVINTAHPFYVTVYQPSSAEVKNAIEVLLFAISEGELDAEGQRELHYRANRQDWSERLRYALDTLSPSDVRMEKEESVIAGQEADEDLDIPALSVS